MQGKIKYQIIREDGSILCLDSSYMLKQIKEHNAVKVWAQSADGTRLFIAAFDSEDLARAFIDDCELMLQRQKAVNDIKEVVQSRGKVAVENKDLSIDISDDEIDVARWKAENAIDKEKII